MPNPALILGRTSGAALETKELMETLDEDTVNALRWQVEMWNEVGTVQKQVKLDALEYGILRGVVLPRRSALRCRPHTGDHESHSDLQRDIDGGSVVAAPHAHGGPQGAVPRRQRHVVSL